MKEGQKIILSSLVGSIGNAHEDVLQELPYHVSLHKQKILAEEFRKAAQRQNWKDVLDLDLGRVEDKIAIDKTNQWLKDNKGAFKKADKEKKDKIVICLREIRDELKCTFFTHAKKSDALLEATIISEKEHKNGSQRFGLRYLKSNGGTAVQGLPELVLIKNEL